MVEVTETSQVAKVTGPGSANRTDARFAIHGTDLGILWDGGDGRVLVLFGDTFGQGWGGDGGGPPEADWRCNVLAYSTSRDLAQGLELDSVIARADGGARQVIASGSGRETTVIPNAGIAIDGRQYVHYMSVREWGQPGQWRTNHAGIAVSTDGGATWDKPRAARWPNRWWRESTFQLGAFARAEGYVYLFGTGSGRFGDIYLARVPEDRVSDVAAYEYWIGDGWAESERAARPVAGGPAGELSVDYNASLGRWLMVHLDEHKAAIVLRTAETLTGPWSAGEVLVSGRDYPALYGGYLHPWALDGPDIYYLISQWGPYNVFLMRSTLAA